MSGHWQGTQFPRLDLVYGETAERSRYPTRDEFMAGLAADRRRLEEDKRKLRQMAAWRRYAQRRAEREVELWAKYRAEQDGPGFPPPMGRRS